MSNILTLIRLPGTKVQGFQDWGRRDAVSMIAEMRERAKRLRAEADAIDAAADADFRVTIVRGSIVQHHVDTLQEGRVRD